MKFSSLRVTLDTYRKYQTSINMNKCIFYVPYGIVLGNVVCKKGLIVEPTKIVVIINLDPQRNVN